MRENKLGCKNYERMINKRRRIAKLRSNIDRPEKLATGNQDEDKQAKYTIQCVGQHYTQANTNNVSKTWAVLQTTGDKDEPNIVFVRKS